MKNRSGEKIKLTSINELLGVVNEESSMEIEISKIHSFAEHPFKVLDDENMTELVESIKDNGVLSPVLVRPDSANGYEMISGHRRMHAAQIAGLMTIPAIIREMTDDDAVIAMVDSNMHRESLSYSEKAWAYKMKLDAMRHQGTCRHDVDKLDGIKSCEEVGDASGLSGRQIQRYIRLTELIPELLEYVDLKRLQFTVAVEVSYINKEVQKWLFEYIRDNGSVKANQIALLREALERGSVSQMKMIMILNDSQPGKAPSKKVTISEKTLRDYFPPEYSTTEMRGVILELLEEWKNREG